MCHIGNKMNFECQKRKEKVFWAKKEAKFNKGPNKEFSKFVRYDFISRSKQVSSGSIIIRLPHLAHHLAVSFNDNSLHILLHRQQVDSFIFPFKKDDTEAETFLLTGLLQNYLVTVRVQNKNLYMKKLPQKGK